MDKSIIAILFVALGLIACNAITSGAEVYQMNTYAITNISVVDVEKGILIPDQTVIVSGGRIKLIGRANQIEVPREATVIDGQGLYLMPGLVDAHVHYFDAPIFGRVLIANGILLVRDMGMPNEYILPLRDQLNSPCRQFCFHGSCAGEPAGRYSHCPADRKHFSARAILQPCRTGSLARRS